MNDHGMIAPWLRSTLLDVRNVASRSRTPKETARLAESILTRCEVEGVDVPFVRAFDKGLIFYWTNGNRELEIEVFSGHDFIIAPWMPRADMRPTLVTDWRCNDDPPGVASGLSRVRLAMDWAFETSPTTERDMTDLCTVAAS